MKRIAFLTVLFILLIFMSGASAKVTYTIRKGDSLFSIAKKFRVSTQDLQKENRVISKNLRPGAKLIIPAKVHEVHAVQEAQTGDLKEAAASSKHAAKKGENLGTSSSDLTVSEPDEKEGVMTDEPNEYHTVKKGDTLKNIAAKYSVSVSDIRTLNGLTGTKLRVDQKLMVRHSGPKTYTVRKGDTLWKIARKFDMDADDLLEINEISATSLRAGQKLYLEEKPDVLNVDQKYLIMASAIEEEIKMVSESSDFTEMTTQDKLATFAKKLLNIPYKFGGNTILGIDCSAYVKKVYGFLGMNLPRTAREQFKEGHHIDKEELSIGDLVFFRTYASFPSHVGIYLGNNLFIHASSKGRKVTINSLDTPYYLKRFIGAKRLISDADGNKLASADPSS